jgi:hypothetical protein
MKYNQKYNQHIPIYLEDSPGDRNQWYFNRINCKDACCWGVPLKVGQQVVISFVRNYSVVPLSFNGIDTIELMNLDGTPTGVNFWGTFAFDKYAFSEDGVLKEIYTVYFTFQPATPCGKYYFKITDVNNNTVWYSEYIQIHESTKEMNLLKIGNDCEIGNIPFEKIIDNDFSLNGYEVYLDPETIIGDPEYITDETFIENANGDEIPLTKKEEKRYKFDTGYVPEYYSEFLALSRGFKNDESGPSCSIKFYDDVNFYPINKIVNQYQNDGFGCFLNNEFSFTIEKNSTSGCCDIDSVLCPDEMAINIVSKQKTQLQAEADVPNVGDVYVVRTDADANPVQNPTWQTNENKYATWNGLTWDFTIPTMQDIINDTDNSNYYIYHSGVWFNGFSAIRFIDNPFTPLDCVPIPSWACVIPLGYFGYIEESTDGVNWSNTSPILNDVQINYYSPGTTYPINTQFEFRVIVVNLNGCNIPQSDNKVWICEIDR